MKKFVTALAFGVAGLLAFSVPALAGEVEGGWYPESDWKLRDHIPVTGWLDHSDHSEIIDATTVKLAREGATEGTSIETDDLGIPVNHDSVVTVQYELDEASPAAGAIRLFVYDIPNAETEAGGDETTRFVAVSLDTSGSGTLTIPVDFQGTLGTVGLTYDASNSEVPGAVTFKNLTVDGTKVLFLEPEPEPSVEPSESASPSEEPSETPSSSAPPVSTGGHLPITGMNIAAMGTAGAGFIGVGLVALLWGMHRRRETE